MVNLGFDCRKFCLHFAILNILDDDLGQTQNTKSVQNLLIYNFVIDIDITFCVKIWFKFEFKLLTLV